MDIHFNCTQCGKCCQGLKLPLTVMEAITWLNRGDPVQILCEASSGAGQQPDEDPKAAHFRRRSFATKSGEMPVRVAVMLAASFAGNCPNLLADMRCGIYAGRPLVCRIYPAEVNPSIELQPAMKSCPSEAWATGNSLFQRDGRIQNAVLRGDILALRDMNASDVEVKRRLCGALQIRDTARAGEGLVVHSPGVESLLAALTAAMQDTAEPLSSSDWRFVSDRQATMLDLAQGGGIAMHVRDAAALPYQFIGFKPER